MRFCSVYAIKVERKHKEGKEFYTEHIYTSYELAQDYLVKLINLYVNDDVSKGSLVDYSYNEIIIKFAEGGQWEEECTCAYRIVGEYLFDYGDNIKWKEIED